MEVSLNKESDSLYVIHLNTDQPSHSVWKLPYPVYQFDYGDVTGDGMPEIIVGVIKPTRFDPKPDKRLFIYRIADEAYIRPLWLGSRVAQPLEDFRVIREHTPVLIRTVERERSGKFLIAEYAWRGFGLDFKGYLKRETEEKEHAGLSVQVRMPSSDTIRMSFRKKNILKVFYSLGNFVFDQRKPETSQSLIVQLNFTSIGYSIKLHPATINNCKPELQ